MAASSSPLHVVIFPFMAQGHTLPLLDISKALSFRGLKVTIITTPLNAPFIHSKVSDRISSISVSVIPFRIVPDLPQGCENTANLPSVWLDILASFITATKNMKQHFEALLKEMVETGSRPICVISDFFLSWTLDTCRSFNIPRVVCHGMGVLPMFSDPCKTSSEFDVIELPSLTLPFTLNGSDLPVCDPDDLFIRVILEVEEADKNSWGVIVKSFQELEGEYVTALEGLYHKEAKAWCVGPVLLYDYIQEQSGASDGKSQFCGPYIEWLDKQEGSSVVIYVSFGTQVRLSKEQMDEIAYGLEMVG
ncbi:UDP-glucose flavonoid 3-O-glucosyltransferase 7 [Rosa chinensis]|uniref:UDP-glucose flavonoid 3-O-glucosyltransferase 7 n=1 Tax=Rosa chinensis TaxID=74649 RepID=UPI000D092A99|nr:UDP-glucose flavonoid 3-O-glucosyltransferase 7 [Rosa chinensis]